MPVVRQIPTPVRTRASHVVPIVRRRAGRTTLAAAAQTGDVYDELNLLHGERVLWSGEPARHPVFDRADLPLIPALLVLLGIGLVEAWTSLSGSASHRLPFVIVGLVVGLYLTLGRPSTAPELCGMVRPLRTAS